MPVKEISFNEMMGDSYLKYAFSVIMGRSIPDLRDGLKPVHRRALQTLNEEGIRSTGRCEKAARAVGSCLGYYHPHGDKSVYDAMIRMAQSWKMNALLIDGQGNIGSVHGDSPAAMRYVEIRSSALCEYAFKDLKKNTVPWTPNYDSSTVEPTLMPFHFPNMLINGTSGMAVGYASEIPPHNPREAIDACLLLLKKKEDCTVDDIMKVMPSPDFPTGGMIINPSAIRTAYETGRSTLRLRAQYEIKDRARGASSIVFKTVPYLTTTNAIREKIAELVKEKKIQVVDCRDESDKRGYSLVVDVPNGVSPEATANLLYQYTQLETSVKLIFNGILDDKIITVGIIDMIRIFLEFRMGVVLNRTSFEFREKKSRKHIVEGLLKATKDIDKVVRIVKTSESKDAANATLRSEFELTERQADAILAMRISQLTKLNMGDLKQENTDLKAGIDECVDILKSPARVEAIITEELKSAQKMLAKPRKTEISSTDLKRVVGDDQVALTTTEEDVVITMSAQGYVKRIPQTAFSSQGRGGKGKKGMKARKDDMIERILNCSSHDDLLVFTDTGKVFGCKAFRIPESAPDKVGSHASTFLSLGDGDRPVEIIPLKKLKKGDTIVICTKGNRIKKTVAEDYTGLRSTGVIAIRLEGDDKILAASVCSTGDHILVGTSEGKALQFPEENINPTNRTTMGVMAINVAKGEKIVNCTIVPKKSVCHVISISSEGNGKKVPIDEFPVNTRNCKGVLAMSRRPDTKMVYVGVVSEEDKGMIITTANGVCIRLRTCDVAEMHRPTKGTRLIRLDAGDSIVSVTMTSDEEEYEEE
jgi:DNA gyrase subunit A